MSTLEGAAAGVVMGGEGANGEGLAAGTVTNGEMAPATHGAGAPDYNQWMAQMQAYYKTGPTTGQPGAQPYYGAQMTPHAAYANLWTGQAPMMTPYGAPGSFYPYPHPGMPPHQSPYGYAPPQGSAASTTGAEYAREGEQKDAEGKVRAPFVGLAPPFPIRSILLSLITASERHS